MGKQAGLTFHWTVSLGSHIALQTLGTSHHLKEVLSTKQDRERANEKREEKRSREPTSVFSLSSTSQLEGEKSQMTNGPLEACPVHLILCVTLHPFQAMVWHVLRSHPYYHLLVHT